MNQTTTAAPTTRREPPLPRFLYKVVNPLMKLMLNSPFHSKMSHELMVLRWTGRRSGKRFSTPVGYVRHNNEVYVFTHSPWWKNFTQGASVKMRMAGKEISGVACTATDPAQIKHMIQTLVNAHGKERAQMMGFWVDNLDQTAPEAVAKAVEGTHFIRIDTELQSPG